MMVMSSYKTQWCLTQCWPLSVVSAPVKPFDMCLVLACPIVSGLTPCKSILVVKIWNLFHILYLTFVRLLTFTDVINRNIGLSVSSVCCICKIIVCFVILVKVSYEMVCMKFSQLVLCFFCSFYSGGLWTVCASCSAVDHLHWHHFPRSGNLPFISQVWSWNTFEVAVILP